MQKNKKRVTRQRKSINWLTKFERISFTQEATEIELQMRANNNGSPCSFLIRKSNFVLHCTYWQSYAHNSHVQYSTVQYITRRWGILNTTHRALFFWQLLSALNGVYRCTLSDIDARNHLFYVTRGVKISGDANSTLSESNPCKCRTSKPTLSGGIEKVGCSISWGNDWFMINRIFDEKTYLYKLYCR